MRQADEQNYAPSYLTLRWWQTLEQLEHTCMQWEINSCNLMGRSKRTVQQGLSCRIWWHLIKKTISKGWETGFKTSSYTDSLLFFLQLHVNSHPTGWPSNMNQSSSTVCLYSIDRLNLKINKPLSQGDHVDILALIISPLGCFALRCYTFLMNNSYLLQQVRTY